MDLTGKKIVFSGKFHGLSRDEATAHAEALGATVQKTPSPKVDLVFRSRDSGLHYGKVIGVPVLTEAAFRHLLPDDRPAEPPAVFTDPAAIAEADADKLRAILEAADWTAFTPDRDLLGLRTRLAEIEASQGITEAHRLATARITGAKDAARLHHPYVHIGDVRSAALSPCGRWLAVGSGIEIPGEGSPSSDWERSYRHGGTLQIFEVATGRSVNGMRNSNAISGGVGWDDYRGALRWSADSTRLAAAYNTNVIGVWDPFDDYAYPIASAALTDGASRPPQFGFSPDGCSVWVDVRTDGVVWGAIANVERGDVIWDPGYGTRKRPYGGDFTTLAEDAPGHVAEALGPRFDSESTFSVEWCPGWSPDGRFLRFVSADFVFAVDTADGRVAWILKHGGRADHWATEVPVEFSPCGRYVACTGRDGVLIADAVTGEVLARHEITAEGLVWSPDGERVAALANGVAVHLIDVGEERRRGMRAGPRARCAKMPDALGFAWSPDGTRGVVRTAEGAEVWSLAGEPERLAVVDAPEDACGVLWGAGDVIVLIGPETVRFTRPDGTAVGEVAFHAAATGRRPLERGGTDHGDYYHINPTFPLDEQTHAVAFDREDLVIAPAGRESEVDAKVAWTVGSRYSWPLRWGATRFAADTREAYDHAVAEDWSLRYTLADVLGVQRD
ncbi:hypothetical protein [Actinoallomurus sp. CA-150999]|uniref:hypothetical protein n=1 Tax=Actinoallomurus sp. CA-150999 TaxID=3239887 RepID=UPI003D91E14E